MVHNANINININANGAQQAAQQVGKVAHQLQGLAAFNAAFRSSQTQAFGAAALGAMAFAKAMDLVGQAFNAVKEYAQQAIQTYAEFSYQLQLLAGLMNIETVAGMENVETAIRSMSQNSAYGILQLTDAYKTLASMGNYNADETEIMIGAFQRLAIVSGTELNQSVTIATQALRVFGYTAEQAAEVSDILYNATKMGALDMYDVGVSLQYVGSNASMCNMTLAETTGLLAILSNRGFTASTAGTSLSMMFDTMINPSDEAKKTMDELGISIYDSAGAMRNMNDIMGDLYVSLEGMTDQQRNAYLTAIFGQRALRASVGLLEFMSESGANARNALSVFSDQLKETDVVTKKYNDVMTTAYVKIKQLQNAWEAFQATMGGEMWGGGMTGFGAMEKSMGGLTLEGEGFTKIFKIVGTLLGQLGYFFALVVERVNLLLVACGPLISILSAGLGVAIWALTLSFKAFNMVIEPLMPLIQALVVVIGLYAIYLATATINTWLHVAAANALNISAAVSNTTMITAAASAIAYGAANLALAGYTWMCNAALTVFHVLVSPITALILAAVAATIAWVIIMVTLIDWLSKLEGILKPIGDLFTWIKGLITGITDAIGGLLGPLVSFVTSLFPHSNICLSYGLELSADNMRDFNKQLKAMDRTVAMITPTISNYGGGVMEAAQGYTGGSTNSVANNVNITIQGDVKDEATIRRIERQVNRGNRAMFLG